MNSQNYDKLFNDYLSKIKDLRDTLEQKTTFEYSLDYQKYLFLKIGDNDYKNYKFLIDESISIACDLIKEIIISLLNEYQIKYIPVQIINNLQKQIPSLTNNKLPQHAFFIIIEHPNEQLYIFRDFGIIHYEIERYAKQIVSNQSGLSDYKEIIYTDDKAYTAKLGYKETSSKPDKGTNMYSLKWFFNNYFPSKEYIKFKNKFFDFMEDVNKYIKMKIIKPLYPNALYSFKNDILTNIYDFPYIDYLSKGDYKIDSSQLNIINNNFFGDSRYLSMISSMNFSNSFLTAEWLYKSIEMDQKIDLTPIALGYFKTIEQFLWNYVLLYNNSGRTIHKKYSTKQYIEISDENIEGELIDNTFGPLISFFDYYKNNDLLETGISENTKEVIIKLLRDLKETRNGYSHKDNLYDSSIVIESREKAYLIYYLILGSYKLSVNDRSKLGITVNEKITDYFKLCEYTLNHRNLIYFIFEGEEVPSIKSFINMFIDIFNLPEYVYSRSIDNNKTYDEDGTIHLGDLKFMNVKTRSTRTIKEEDTSNITIIQIDHVPGKKPGLICKDAKIIFENGKFIN